MTTQEKISRTKIGQGYYQSGYGRGLKKRPIIWLINDKAYAKDARGQSFQTDLEGYVMVNSMKGADGVETFWQCGLISEHAIYSTITKPSLEELRGKINELETKIAMHPATDEQAEEARAAWRKATNHLTEEKCLPEGMTSDVYNELFTTAQRLFYAEEVAGYRETLELDLIQVNTRYLAVAVQQDLSNPSGFHPSSRVYVRPEGDFVASDRMSELPGGYYCFDLNKI